MQNETQNHNSLERINPVDTSQDSNPPASRPLPSIAKLAAALALAQGEIPPPAKKRKVDFIDLKGRRVHYMYADLADVIDCVRTALSKNGLAVTHRLELDSKGYGMITELMHSSGESISTWYPLPNPQKAEIRAQEMGSALTYARRYTLSALLGIASEEDDDGADAPPTTPPNTPGPAPKPSPVKSPVKSKAAAPATPPAPKPTEPPTKQELAKLFAIAQVATWTTDQVRIYLETRFALLDTANLTRDEYDEFCETLKTQTFPKAMLRGARKAGGSS